ncbi:glycosyltransferase family 1 protein [uncultured Clostridium sp.]|jgi:glycosyltransferase involved in cell wall biosynthesis|uniref:glycosyltransferase family 4 protein n=1 Tax=uncultured Clostridium sp. TaxID=59620 RepID=UPI002616BEDA|nr:glycosyltransferase family 1 protein [uncultured Clostridium sp.]
MKILIDSRGASWYRGTGIGTYTHNLLQGLISIDKTNEYHLFCSGATFNDYKAQNTTILMSSRKHKGFFEEFYMPEYIKNNDIEIFHVPQNGIGLTTNENNLNIVTIHDLIPYVLPETTGPSYLKNFLKKIPLVIENCDGILTVSEYSKKDILKFFPSFPSERIFVTPLAANTEYKPLDKAQTLANVQKRFDFTSDYIMYIGGFSTRKNIQGLLETFDNICKNLNKDVKLLIVGGLREEGKRLELLSKTLTNSDKIIFTGFIEEEYLPTLYNGCSLFVYPSFYEGFGLPPLEAMSCGTPALSSNTTSIPEVVKIKDLLFDPYSNVELEEKLITLLNNDKLLKELSEKSLTLSKEFSWKNTASKTLSAYQQIYELGKK